MLTIANLFLPLTYACAQSPDQAAPVVASVENGDAADANTPALAGAPAVAPPESGVPAAVETPAPVPAAAPEFDRSLPIDERFLKPISLNLNNIDVVDALRFISVKSGANIISTKNVTGRVTVDLDNVPIKDVFDIVLRSNGLAYVRKGDVFQVMSEAEYKALNGRNFSDSRVVKVLRLNYAIPEQIFSMIDALKSDIGRVLIDQESGNILLMDTAEQIKRIESALQEFERENLVEVFVLKYAKAKDVEDILKTRLDAKKVGTVKADERSNQLIIQTFPERMEEVKRLIAKLDRPTKQVLVETKIIKIKLSKQMDRGLEWEGIFNIASKDNPAYVGSYPFSYVPAGVTNAQFKDRASWFAQQNQNIASYPFSGTTSSLNSSTKVSPGEKLHFGLFDNDRDFDVLYNYLDTIGDSKVLANPRLVITNNQEAKIHIGERQAYVTTTTTSGQTTSTIAEEVTFVDVGIQLSITPIINDDGFITMKVKPEISNVGSTLITPTNNKIPIIDTTLTETTIMMKDNVTLIIGGLRKEEKTVSSQQLPFLGSLPGVGNFFKTSTDKTDRTEIVVMITPRIISGTEFVTGSVREPGEAPDQGYREYQPITGDREMLPGGMPEEIGPKAYREYDVPQAGAIEDVPPGVKSLQGLNLGPVADKDFHIKDARR